VRAAARAGRAARPAEQLGALGAEFGSPRNALPTRDRSASSQMSIGLRFGEDLSVDAQLEVLTASQLPSSWLPAIEYLRWADMVICRTAE
jgi:hypothetical protein